MSSKQLFALVACLNLALWLPLCPPSTLRISNANLWEIGQGGEGLVGKAHAAAPPPRPLKAAQAQQLIEQLADPDYRNRELAEQRLRLEGGGILPLLRKALGHKEAEVRRRALRLIPGIENAKLFAPKRVTFRVSNQPLKKVLEELSKASGYKVVADEDGHFPRMFPNAPGAKRAVNVKQTNFSYEFVNEPFWDVIDRLCRDADLTLQQSWGDDSVRLYRSQGHAPFMGRHGPFHYVASNLQLYRNVDLNSNAKIDRTETLTFNLMVHSEPRLPLMGMGDVRLDSAYDELKNSMVPSGKAVEESDEFQWRRMRFMGRQYSGQKQTSMAVSFPLERRSGKAKTLKSVKGVVPMTVLVEQKPIVLAEKVLSAKGTKKVIGELTFEVQEVKKTGAQVEVKLNVSQKGGNDYTWQNSIYNRVELSDDKGNKYQIWGTGWGGAGPNMVNLRLTFNNSNAKPGEPGKLVFVHWETRQHDVEFEFRDVPLP